MSALGITFEEEFEHKLDKKLRVSVPSCWRPSDNRDFSIRLLKWKVEGIPVLKALTEDAFQALIASINNDETLNAGKKSRKKGALFTHNTKVSVNDQGKILIPKKLAEERGFEPEGKVHLLGRGNYFELLTPKDYLQLMEDEEDVLENLYDTVDFG